MKNIKYIIVGIIIVIAGTLYAIDSAGTSEGWPFISIVFSVPALLAMMTWRIYNKVSEESK